MPQSSFLLSFTMFFCLSTLWANAQVDTTLSLPNIEVLGQRLRINTIGERTETWDSTALSFSAHTNLAELLEEESGVFIKNFGPGTLATLSVRGGNAGQTAVLWNGLPLQSPMLGLLDVSLLSTNLIDHATLKLGGNSSLWGSGSISGVISLENSPVFDAPFQVEIAAVGGSFGQFDQSLKSQWGGKKMGFSTTLSRTKSDNDFPYSLANGEEKQLSNAQRRQVDLLQEFYWKINENQQLSLHAWWQKADRGIPPTTTQTRSEATQKDDAKRLAIHWKRTGQKAVWSARAGFFQEEIDYRDPQILLESLTHFWTLMGDIEGNFHLKNQAQFSVGGTQFFTRAFADAYRLPPTESRSSIFASFRKKIARTNTQVTVRQSLVDGELIGFSPSLFIEHEISNQILVRGKVSRSYRIPTFNDRFWQPGGNPDLQPEHGWGQEAGLDFSPLFPNLQAQYGVTIFNRTIHDWILWAPQEGTSFWGANNLAKVWSRGIEQRLNLSLQNNKVNWVLSFGYDYIRSTNVVAIEIPALKKGEQLIYTPVHQAFGGIQTKLGTWSIGYRHRMVSNFSGQNENLAGHHLGYFRLRKNIAWPSFSGSAFFKIENTWNEEYRVVERRPMPGRSIQIGLNLKFTK